MEQECPSSGRTALFFGRIHPPCCFQILVFALLPLPCLAADGSGPPALTIDANLYPYLDRVDNDTDMTFVINARLPARFSYFSYMNFRGIVSDPDASFSRSEQNLRWSLSEDLPFDLNFQSILVEGDGNDVMQLGLGWRVSDTGFLKAYFDRMNLLYRLTFHLKRFSSGDDKVWQMEHFFKMSFPYISDRLYLSGFVDQTFDQSLPPGFPQNPVVTEIQLGMRLFDKFHAVTEYRINDFRNGNETNLAIGVEYKFRW